MDLATLVVRGETVLIRQFEVAVIEGADRGARAVSRSDELSIGSDEPAPAASAGSWPGPAS